VWLDSPLGHRIVVDVDSGNQLQRFSLGRPDGSEGSFLLFIPAVGDVAWLPLDDH
jgi:hypothetical protein